MPLGIVAIGIVLVLVGLNNTYGDFGRTLKNEFVGPGNFLFRAAAILMIGVIGYAGEGWRRLSVALLVLMTIGLLLTKDKGVFGQLGKGVSASPVKPIVNPSTTTGASAPAPQQSNFGAVLKQGTQLLTSAAALLAA